MRIVLDTNILISSQLSPFGLPRQILNLAESGEIELVLSPYILSEVETVFAYPKIKKRLPLAKIYARDFVKYLESFASIIDPTKEINEVRDPKDNPILAVFLESGADYLVSGDKDLFSLKEQYPAIVSPKEFLEAL